MPQNITDVDIFTDPIVAPADGDALAAASVVTGFQGLGNRTKNHDNILKSTGVTLIRSGSLATMAALTPVTNTTVFYATDGLGLYYYNSGSAAAADGLTVVTAAPGGRWIAGTQPALGIANGLIKADATGRAPATSVRNGLVDTQTTSISGSFGAAINALVNVTSFTDVGGGTSVTFTAKCNDGDLLLINMGATLLGNNTPTTAEGRVMVVDGATNSALPETVFQVANNTALAWPVATRYTLAHVGTGGTATVKVQIRSLTAAQNVALTYPFNMCVQLVRP